MLKSEQMPDFLNDILFWCDNILLVCVMVCVCVVVTGTFDFQGCPVCVWHVLLCFSLHLSICYCLRFLKQLDHNHVRILEV